jgi:hypothetical protein
VEPQDVRVGMRVRVSEGEMNPNMRGRVGTVEHRYGHPSYSAFDVKFADGKLELFWHYQIEEAEASSEGF